MEEDDRPTPSGSGINPSDGVDNLSVYEEFLPRMRNAASQDQKANDGAIAGPSSRASSSGVSSIGAVSSTTSSRPQSAGAQEDYQDFEPSVVGMEAKNSAMMLECRRHRNKSNASQHDQANSENGQAGCECERLCESLGMKKEFLKKSPPGVKHRKGEADPDDLPHNRIRRGNVCEAWQSTKSCLKERITFLFNNDTLSDVSFVVGRTRTSIPGHKFVLAIGSPVFDAMFNGPLQEINSSVELPDVEPEALLALFKFLYSDEVSLSAESVLTVLYTAKKYAVPTLEEHCVAFLKDNLTPENSFLLLSQARLFDEPQLAALCLDCIDKNTAAAINGECFLEVDLSTLCVVLARDTLRIREYTLFTSVLRWAKQECIRRSLEVTAQNQRHVLERALQLIRFPLIPVEEFSLEVAQTGLLTESELVRLYLNFTISPIHIARRPRMEFSDRPRCYMTGKQLSVYRFQQVDTRWGYNGLSDQIRFEVDRRIYIVGFGLYGGLYGTKEYKVDIQISNTSTQTVLGHHSDAFASDGSKSTFKIMFKEPIEILPDVMYTASSTLRGPDSYYGAKGQKRVLVECPDKTAVTFSFSYSSDNNNGTSVEDGQIPEIIFHT